MNYDITFCSKTKCKILKCKRNQNNIPKIEYKTRFIWQGDFKECKYWNKKYIHSDSLYVEEPIEEPIKDKKNKTKEYQHKYYLEVTKKKRQEKRSKI